MIDYDCDKFCDRSYKSDYSDCCSDINEVCSNDQYSTVDNYYLKNLNFVTIYKNNDFTTDISPEFLSENLFNVHSFNKTEFKETFDYKKELISPENNSTASFNSVTRSINILMIEKVEYKHDSEKNNSDGATCAEFLRLNGIAKCCLGRDDDYYISYKNNSTCYCDEFCDRSGKNDSSDCCPDYEETCLKKSNATLRDLLQEKTEKDCTYQENIYKHLEKFKHNCENW